MINLHIPNALSAGIRLCGALWILGSVLVSASSGAESPTEFEMRRAQQLQTARVTDTNLFLRSEVDRLRAAIQATNQYYQAIIAELQGRLAKVTKERDDALEELRKCQKERAELAYFKALVLHPRYGFLRADVAWHSDRGHPRPLLGGTLAKATYRTLYSPYFGNMDALNWMINKRFDHDWDNTGDEEKQGSLAEPEKP